MEEAILGLEASRAFHSLLAAVNIRHEVKKQKTEASGGQTRKKAQNSLLLLVSLSLKT